MDTDIKTDENLDAAAAAETAAAAAAAETAAQTSADTTSATETAADAAAPGAAGAADATAAAEAEAPAPDAAALAAALAEEKDRNVRLYADFENFRRRMERERLETWARAERDVLSAVLPIADNFDRAMAQAGDDPFSEGVRLVHASLLDFLKKHEVAAIETVGKPFDPAIHEAVAYQPSPGAPEGTVIYETRKGYKAGETVLRPASVIVSSGKPEA